MTGLLVSVRDREEAVAAMSGGADVIDVKEPGRGALGAADPQCLREIAETVAGRLPLSAAWGELADNADPPDPAWLAGYRYLKLGLAGSAAGDWRLRWRQRMAALPAATRPVAVVYADWKLASAPEPPQVLDHAVRTRCAAVLFDTFHKHRGNLFDHLPATALLGLIAPLRQAAIPVVLGGSLSAATIAEAVALQPDYIAVRGAVCGGGRSTALQARLVHQLAAQIRGEKCRLAARPSGIPPFA